MSLRRTLRDTSGASIVIALVFFLICGIVGSAVVTAASVQAKSVQTHEDMQQAEFTMTSAAQSIGYDLDMAKLTVVEGATGVTVAEEQGYSLFGGSFWNTYGPTIMANRKNHESTKIADTLTIQVDGYEGLDPVYGEVTVDADLNIFVRLSLSPAFEPTSPYNMMVSIQCIPTYDNQGNLLSFSYERAVVQKEGDAS